MIPNYTKINGMISSSEEALDSSSVGNQHIANDAVVSFVQAVQIIN